MMLVKQAIIAVVYALAAVAGLLLAFPHSNASPVWPPTGIALAAVLMMGYRIWPGIAVGAFLANLWILSSLDLSLPLSVTGALCTATGNTLEALIGCFLIRRFTADRPPLSRSADVVIFVLLGAFAASTVSATIGVTTLSAISGNGAHFGKLWMTWWLGDAAGALIVAPVILTWSSRISGWTFRKAAEAGALLVLLLGLGFIVFRQSNALQYLFIPLCVWVAYRFGRFESAFVCLLLSVMSIVGTLNGGGPFFETSLNSSLLIVQGYVGVVTVTTMLLSALLTERNAVLTAIATSNAELQHEVVVRKRAEEALLKEKSLLRCIIDSVNDLIFIKDRNSVYVACNKSSERFIGLTEREQVGKTDFDLLDREVAERVRKDDRLVIDGGGMFRGEEWVTYPDGHRVLLDTYKAPFYGPDGEIQGLVGICRDITDRKRAEDYIRKLNAELEQRVQERTAELERKNIELERMNKLFVGREMRIIELKKKVDELQSPDRPDADNDAESAG